MKNLDLTSLRKQLHQLAGRFYRYRVMLFFLGLACLYGFVLLRINSLSQAEPSSSQLSAQAQAHSLKVDPQVVKKIQQLQDNSANVQSLFDQARNNPFHE